MPTPDNLIRYNLRQRGREHTGTPRNYDIPALVSAINGPATQERVRTRGMLGYYGHWPRLKFGLYPSEGGIDSGAVLHVEPAVVTTHLQAFDDGTVEHRTEFLDTVPGRKARRCHDSRVGGFSSAIDPIGPVLAGFDYVADPNYVTNRGFSLDSAAAGPELDAQIEAERQAMDRMLVNALEAQERTMAALLDDAKRREIEVERLEMLVDTLREKLDAAANAPSKSREIITDAVRRETEAALVEIKGFHALDLPPIVTSRPKAPTEQERAYQSLIGGLLRW